MSKAKDIHEDELEVLVNEHLDRVRDATMRLVDESSKSKNATAYMIALGMHLGELMWASKISTEKAVGFAVELFKSAYEQCDEMERNAEKGESNEEAK